jgi:4-amino-4-deoxy-L-arabinose transferase-like glycosyltransferase
LTCIPIFLIARKQFGERTAVCAGWAWAFFPYAIYFSADFIWATTLTTLLVSLIFLYALHLEESCKLGTWVGYGALCGISALTDPIVLSVAVPLLLWMAFRLLQQKVRWVMPAGAAALMFALIIAPWFVRNYEVFHTVIPFRDNAGLELYTGNTGQTWHFAPSGFHPSDTPREWTEFQQAGELRYMAHKRQQAFEFIRAHPGVFAVLSVRRAIYVWTNFWSFGSRYLAEEPADPYNIFLCTSLTIMALVGLAKAFRRNRQIAVPFAIALFFFPLVYYVTHTQDYFRRPIDPIFVVLAVYAVVQWRADRRLATEAPRVLAKAAGSFGG